MKPLALGAVLFVALKQFVRIDVEDYHLVLAAGAKADLLEDQEPRRSAAEPSSSLLTRCRSCSNCRSVASNSSSMSRTPPRAVRAVGSACGANPAALVIPCHRALRADGGLGGYAWGLERKRRLLAIEKRTRR